MRKSDLEILDVNVSEQEKGIYKEGWREIPRQRQNVQKLSKEKILELSKLIVKIENHYTFPVDIEWALEGETFYITQSRPITTLTAS